jgi:hypothetical protein
LHGKTSKVCLALGKKSPTAISTFFFLSFFFSPNKQKTEHQSESNSVTSWTPSPQKVSPCHATLKKEASFLPTCQSKAACMKLQNEQVSITHHMQHLYPFPEKIIQHRPWAD